MKKFFFVFLILFSVISNSCINSAQDKNQPDSGQGIPEILTAEYKIKSFNQTEQGFEVFLVINNLEKSERVKAIVLKNRLFKPITSNEMLSGEIFIEQFLIVNSQLIVDFVQPPADSRQDGIIFENGNDENFVEVEFKFKTEK